MAGADWQVTPLDVNGFPKIFLPCVNFSFLFHILLHSTLLQYERVSILLQAPLKLYLYFSSSQSSFWELTMPPTEPGHQFTSHAQN